MLVLTPLIPSLMCNFLPAPTLVYFSRQICRRSRSLASSTKRNKNGQSIGHGKKKIISAMPMLVKTSKNSRIPTYRHLHGVWWMMTFCFGSCSWAHDSRTIIVTNFRRAMKSNRDRQAGFMANTIFERRLRNLRRSN